MSDNEYKRNRTRVAEIQGINPNSPDHSCHHWFIFRRDVKAKPLLKGRVNKLENLFMLTNEEHRRVEELLKGQPCVIDSPTKRELRRRGKQHRK